MSLRARSARWLAAVVLAASAGAAEAAPVRPAPVDPHSVSWPYRTITYYPPRLKRCESCKPVRHPAAVERAIDAWNHAHVGYQLVADTETFEDANKRRWPRANVVFDAQPRDKPFCYGETTIGFTFD